MGVHRIVLISTIDRESYNGQDYIAENTSDAFDRDLNGRRFKSF